MSISPLPTPLQQLGGRRFSFYPPILNVPHNEWIYRRASWAEFVVVNTGSGEEACIPRIFLGDVSLADSVGVPAVIVGLKRELEWKAGVVSPRLRPVIELPMAVNDSRPATRHPQRLAPVVNIRLEPHPEIHAVKKIGVAMMLGAMVLLVVADVARQMQMRQRADVFRISRSWLQLTPADDYFSVLRKLGTPASDRTLRGPDGSSRRVLSYPGREFRVVLAGAPPRYIGTLDPRGRILGAVSLPDGSSAAQLLRSLPSF
ncbi:MAG: hypothetical protein ABSB15_13820 [Bryobacteraceae bacterium]